MGFVRLDSGIVCFPFESLFLFFEFWSYDGEVFLARPRRVLELSLSLSLSIVLELLETRVSSSLYRNSARKKSPSLYLECTDAGLPELTSACWIPVPSELVSCDERVPRASKLYATGDPRGVLDSVEDSERDSRHLSDSEKKDHGSLDEVRVP